MLINETQKAAVFKTDDDDLRAELAQSRESMRLYAVEVEQELNSVQELVNQLEREVSSAQLHYSTVSFTNTNSLVAVQRKHF